MSLSFKKKRLVNSVKISILTLAISTTIIPTQHAEANVPVIDLSSIGKIIAQTTQQADNFKKEMLSYLQQMTQDIMLSSQQMRNDFNRSIMEVGNITDVQSQTHNIYMLAELSPDAEAACTVLTINKMQGEATLTSETVTRKSMSNYVSRNMPKAGENPNTEISGIATPFEYRVNLFEKLEELDNKYMTSDDFTGESGEDGSVYLNPSYLFLDNMTAEEFEIASVQKEILAGPPQPAFAIENTDSTAYKSEFVSRSRRMIMKSFAVHAIQDIISARYTASDGELSKIGALEQYLDSTIRDEEWIKRYTNTNQDVNQLTSPAQVQRQLTVMQGKRLEIEMLNYKQMEQIKGLLATQALISLED